jgi:NAD(P)H-flavin reductase
VHDAVAFLCGHSAMISDVRQLLAKRGLPTSSTFLNTPEG